MFDQFIEHIPTLGLEYFTRLELDYLEETKLIDIGVLALLLTLPPYNPLIHQHKYEWFHEKNTTQLVDSSYYLTSKEFPRNRIPFSLSKLSAHARSNY